MHKIRRALLLGYALSWSCVMALYTWFVFLQSKLYVSNTYKVYYTHAFWRTEVTEKQLVSAVNVKNNSIRFRQIYTQSLCPWLMMWCKSRQRGLHVLKTVNNSCGFASTRSSAMKCIFQEKQHTFLMDCFEALGSWILIVLECRIDRPSIQIHAGDAWTVYNGFMADVFRITWFLQLLSRRTSYVPDTLLFVVWHMDCDRKVESDTWTLI